ncbi:ABC transporter ATP-binding protein uup [mine drainage metagenome]|uniref:ABC transporter ATP-binding protein uup n=1 Tax=mine drainage metagenome TaxID=410659 RepID=A0A1J5P6X6_9ZZZZ
MKSLSGGERNRLLLARLFARPANVLVLDEPTNDLDIDTLELLEQLLQDFDGTVFLVSHDRRFLDNVVTSTIVWEGTPDDPGRWREYEGGVTDWLTQSQRARSLQAQLAKSATSAAGKLGAAASVSGKPAAVPAVPQAAAPPAKRKLSYKEQRELQELPGRIAALEAEQKSLSDQLADPDTYTAAASHLREMQERFAQIDEELPHALERWEILDGK